MTKIQIYFVIYIKNDFYLKKLYLFLCVKRHIFYEEDLIHKIISCYMTQTKQTTIPGLFLYFKNLHA